MARGEEAGEPLGEPHGSAAHAGGDKPLAHLLRVRVRVRVRVRFGLGLGLGLAHPWVADEGGPSEPIGWVACE